MGSLKLFETTDVTSQPVFYLFIGITILLTLGYSWGRRANKRIVIGALDDLQALFKPKDQQFTNIGGLTGYHANFIPLHNRHARRVDATCTLLPRQSWLYYPISRMIRRFDRLYLVFHLAEKAVGTLTEGHLIERRYSAFMGAKVENAAELERESFEWGGLQFELYYEDQVARDALLDVKARLGEPGGLRHVALVPEQDRMFLFMIPVRGTVGKTVGVIFEWFNALVDARLRQKQKP